MSGKLHFIQQQQKMGVSNDSVSEAAKPRGVEQRGVPLRGAMRIDSLCERLGAEWATREVGYLKDQTHAYKVKVDGSWSYHNTAQGVIDRLLWSEAMRDAN